MTNLTDIQRMLLSGASQRENGSLLPLPAGIAPGGGTAKVLAGLVRRLLAEERETDEASATHRKANDTGYGLFVTSAGLAAIGAEEPDVDNVESNIKTSPDASAAARSKSKIAVVTELIRRNGGATLAELIEVTGWLPHTMRAALTGLRKKGHGIERIKRGDVTCYRIVAAG